MHSYAKNSFQTNQLLRKLQKGENPDKLNRNNETSLIVAVKNKNYLGVSILLSYKADPDAVDRFFSTSLHWSCISKDYNLTEVLLKNNANVEVYDINHQTPLDYIVENRSLKLLNLIKDYLSSSKLRKLISKFLHKKDYEIVENLVCFKCMKGYECDILNTIMVVDDSYAMFKMLNILKEKIPILFIGGDFWINKLLTKCVKIKKHNCLDIILDYSTNINLSESGETLLHVASKINNVTAVEKLLQYGANPRLRNCNKRLPIHFAAINHNTELVNYLSQYYFDPNIKDIEGNCFLEYLIDMRDYKLCYLYTRETDICNLYNSMLREVLISYRFSDILYFSRIYKNIQVNIFEHWKYVIMSFYEKTGKDFRDIGSLVKSFLFKL